MSIADCVREVWVISGNIVDQCPSRSLRGREREERAGKKRKKSFRRGGEGRDGCSPEIWVDILGVVDKGFSGGAVGLLIAALVLEI